MPTADNHDPHERFTRLLLEHEPKIMRSILVVVPNLPDAREIMQETAVALWRQFASYDPSRPFINWAMGFSRIETRRFLARQKRRAQLTEAAITVLEDELRAQPDIERATERHLAACLAKLPDKHRRIIQGYYHEGRSPEWISEREGRTVEAIYKALQRIRRSLQQCIETQWKLEQI